ncbi:methyltransferase domain-containing protein [Brevundimonas aveniformis]|uniref:methyltransferase domain-containing protein n=1 Tax=Brevundimonas aveniformis TaxID=370977 RepID=UPI0024939D8C|nr:methyltransferase domain-containing protein [Brevundimonas aveniformis]
MSAPPQLFDWTLRRGRLERAMRGNHTADFLRRRVAEDMASTLMGIVRDFPEGVDLSARDRMFERALAEAGGAARVCKWRRMDQTGEGLDSLQDNEVPALAEGSADLVVSLLSLHWTNDLPGVLSQIRRSLRPDGLFIGSLFGGASLNELRWALGRAETELTGGQATRVSPFADAFDGAGLLQRAGFALPVSDIDRLTVTYADPFALIRDLRAMGETALFAERQRPLTRAVVARMAGLYAERYADQDGRIPATFEIVTLSGWAPHPDQQKPLRPGSAKMRLSDALGVEEGKL